VRSLRALVRAGAAATLLLALAAAPGAARQQRRSCASYPHPGTTVEARTPASLRAEYAILSRPRRKTDALAPSQLTGLAASGIIIPGIRFLSAAPQGGRVFLVPAEHMLSFSLAPARCLAPQQRGVQQSLLTELHREYAHHALCLVIVYPSEDFPSCQAAPGTVDPLLYAPGASGFGLVPDGVPDVTVHYLPTRSRRAAVHHNFWLVRGTQQAACGVDWTTGSGIVLRVVKSCVPDTD
jgi:hypothetical protein